MDRWRGLRHVAWQGGRREWLTRLADGLSHKLTVVRLAVWLTGWLSGCPGCLALCLCLLLSHHVVLSNPESLPVPSIFHPPPPPVLTTTPWLNSPSRPAFPTPSPPPCLQEKKRSSTPFFAAFIVLFLLVPAGIVVGALASGYLDTLGPR